MCFVIITAYFQENDAIATVDIVGGTVKDLKPLPRKKWDGIKIDASDRDGGNGTSGNFEPLVLNGSGPKDGPRL